MVITANLIIIVITCAISIYAFNNPQIIQQFRHYPYHENSSKNFSGMLTAGFLHANYMHLGVNMWVLYIFGSEVERHLTTLELPQLLGNIIYVMIYITTIIGANYITFMKHKNNAHFSSIGASGAVSGVMFMFILLHPWSTLNLYFAIPIYAILFGIGYLVYSSWAAKNNQNGIDHMAHFYGAVIGMILFIAVSPSIFTDFIKQMTNVPFLH